ncbi:hypothetical protein BD413DRAFT_28074 [Trametes elegans]|nr:hypothetical protein BD413DRAFT_28074 [Trametes elegans]
MIMLKPKISSASHIHNPISRCVRKVQQGDDPKGKKKTLNRGDVSPSPETMIQYTEILSSQIASHLAPLDILQLARCSKDLRVMLLARDSRHTWQAARKNILPPMPDCPEHMSEACYAHLLFERICDACGVNQSVNVDYAIPARFCRPCWKAESVLDTRQPIR